MYYRVAMTAMESNFKLCSETFYVFTSYKFKYFYAL